MNKLNPDLTNYFEIGIYAAKRRAIENDIKLLSEDLLIQKFMCLKYLPINSSVGIVDQTIIAHAIEYRKMELLQKITNFSVKRSLELIKKKIFTAQLQLSDSEIQETLDIAKGFHVRLTDFYQYLQKIWR